MKIVETAGAGGVLVYWDSEDAPDNVDYPSNASFIPYAAAVTYTTGMLEMYITYVLTFA